MHPDHFHPPFIPGGRRTIVLTIAGSDSGGGAGIQADLKTIAAYSGYGLSVITALTAQSGLGVYGVHAPDPDFVVLQLTTVLNGFCPNAAKTGMLFSAPIIAGAARVLRERKRFPLVVDPVSVSQSGHALLLPDAVLALKTELLPLADLVTPNRPEAEMLAGMSIGGPDDVPAAIEKILALGPKAVLLKGGHFEASTNEPGKMVDWLGRQGQDPVPLIKERVNTPHTHGTGCTLSAAIAAGLGSGLRLVQAVRLAQEYLTVCLKAAYAPGQGLGPPDHMAPFFGRSAEAEDIPGVNRS